MKNVVMRKFALALFLLLSLNCNAQEPSSKVTNKDLKGEWIGTGVLSDSKSKMVLTFTDSSISFKLIEPFEYAMAKGIYTLDNTKEISLITITTNEIGVIHTVSQLIKLISKDSIKLQGIFNTSTTIGDFSILDREKTSFKWEEPETDNNTMLLVRRKEKN